MIQKKVVEVEEAMGKYQRTSVTKSKRILIIRNHQMVVFVSMLDLRDKDL
jgi:hypothetical protein